MLLLLQLVRAIPRRAPEPDDEGAVECGPASFSKSYWYDLCYVIYSYIVHQHLSLSGIKAISPTRRPTLKIISETLIAKRGASKCLAHPLTRTPEKYMNNVIIKGWEYYCFSNNTRFYARVIGIDGNKILVQKRISGTMITVHPNSLSPATC